MDESDLRDVYDTERHLSAHQLPHLTSDQIRTRAARLLAKEVSDVVSSSDAQAKTTRDRVSVGVML